MGKLSEFNSNPKNEKVTEEDIKNKYNSYKGMNKNELNAQLMQEVARQKSSGTFDYASLSNMVESLKGALPDSDYQNIKRLLESLK